jgi:hypothetical protein
LVMIVMIIQPLIELYIRSSPFRIHSPAWRLALIGNASGAISAPILGLFFILAIAVAAEDRGASYAVSSVSAAFAVFCLAGTAAFALDALQMRSQVQANLSESYGLTSAWIATKLLISVIVLLVLAISAFRAAQGAKSSAAPARGKSSAVLIGATRPGVVASPAARPAVESESR